MLYKWTLTLTLTMSSFFTQQAVVQMEFYCAVQVDIDLDIDLAFLFFFTQQAVVQKEYQVLEGTSLQWMKKATLP